MLADVVKLDDEMNTHDAERNPIYPNMVDPQVGFPESQLLSITAADDSKIHPMTILYQTVERTIVAMVEFD